MIQRLAERPLVVGSTLVIYSHSSAFGKEKNPAFLSGGGTHQHSKCGKWEREYPRCPLLSLLHAGYEAKLKK